MFGLEGGIKAGAVTKGGLFDGTQVYCYHPLVLFQAIQFFLQKLTQRGIFLSLLLNVLHFDA